MERRQPCLREVGEVWTEIALFKRADGSYLIADSNIGCCPACSGSIAFNIYKAGKWTNVTKQFVPKISTSALFAAFKAKGGTNPEIVSEGGAN